MTTRDEAIRLRESAEAWAEEYLQCKGEYHPDFHEVADERLITLAKNDAYREAAKVCRNRYLGDRSREDMEARNCESAVLALVKEE